MLWYLFKKIVFIVLMCVGISYAIIHFAPKSFEENTIKRCASDRKGIGACAGKDINKGDSIGFIMRTTKEDQVITRSEYGSLLSKTNKQANISLVPLFLDDGYIDLYGYAIRNISEGEELLVNQKEKLSKGLN